MYKVLGMAKSRSTRVVWTLEEIGTPYEHIPVMPHSEEVLAHHPLGKVPILLTDEGPLLESSAICTWLADRHAEANLIPAPGTRSRAEHDMFTAFAATELEQPLWTMAKHSFILPKEMRIAEVKPLAKQEFARVVTSLERLLGDRQFCVGEQFTVADILLGHTLRWATAAKVPVESDAVQAYAERVWARPALARAWEAEEASQQ